MTKKTVEVIVEIATELFSWAVGIFKEKSIERRRRKHDSARASKEK